MGKSLKRRRKQENRRDWICWSVLLFFLVAMITAFCGAQKNIEEYEAINNRIKNLVTVKATVEAAFPQTIEEIQWDAGAGDVVDRNVTKTTYFDHRVSYSFDGKEYTGGYGGKWCTTAIPVGSEVELEIDASDPEYIFDGSYPPKPDYDLVWFFLGAFLVTFVIWLLGKMKFRKEVKQDITVG